MTDNAHLLPLLVYARDHTRHPEDVGIKPFQYLGDGIQYSMSYPTSAQVFSQASTRAAPIKAYEQFKLDVAAEIARLSAAS